MKQKMKEKAGITLIALVVTIVVLLILAGVSILVLFGDNGMIKTAQESTLQTKLAEIEERANIAYEDLNSKKYAEGNPNKKISMLDIKTELEKIDKEKYQIRIENLEGSTIKGIKLSQTSIKLGKGNSEVLEATFDIEDNNNTIYYAKVEEKYYEISIKNNHINLDKTNGKTEDQIENTGTVQTKEITAVSSNNDVATATTTQTDAGATITITAKNKIETVTITVTCKDLAPKECTVTVAAQPLTESNANPETPIETYFGKVDIIWLDENNNMIPEPKAPILQGKTNSVEGEKVKMVPVKWDGTGADAILVDTGVDETNAEITLADGSKEKAWYDYKPKEGEGDNTTSRWANAKTENGSYFVWIPRYAYRITYYKSEKDHTITGYYDGYGMWNADTGVIKYKLEDGIETVQAEDGERYIVHPAFGTSNKKGKETNVQYDTRKTQNINNGGWGEALPGFWFAKFEMSGTTRETLKSEPGVTTVTNYKKVGEFYTLGRTATYGHDGTVDDAATDDITEPSFMNSHMIKNSEWGAVAYLTHSQYGRNGAEVKQNSYTSYRTSLLKNISLSTTGNPFGVYDMNGGVQESVALFGDQDAFGHFEDYSQWTVNTSLTTSSNSTKYATLYNVKGSSGGTDIYAVGKTGDASKEIFASTSEGWFSNKCYFPSSSGPFLVRGGNRKTSSFEAGIFCGHNWTGGMSDCFGFRTALSPST